MAYIKPLTVMHRDITRANRISKASTKIDSYKACSRWSRVEFDERIAKLLPTEEHALNVEYGHLRFYDDETDS